MPDNPHLLLPSQKRKAIEICVSHGLAENSFDWQETVEGGLRAPLVNKLVHRPSDYYFTFDFYPDGDMKDFFSPSELKRYFESERHESWETRWEHFETWVTYLARELHALDYLSASMLGSRSFPFYDSEIDDNKPFDETEREHVIRVLDSVENRIFELREFTENEAQFVRREIDNLRRESAQSGRRSWYQMSIGALVSIFSAFFDVDTAKEIWNFLIAELGNVFRLTN